jgi:anti-sigma B factor antagonist
MVDLPPFECRVSRDGGGRALLSLSGELDLVTASRLWSEVRAVLGDPAVSEAVIDLGELRFVDSSGLEVFVDIRRVLESRHGRLTLTRPQSAVRMTLRITGLDDLIDVASDGFG